MAFELPLFPLQTVLFPGMPFVLHIFEQRYRQMIGECLRDDQPFGVVLIREGEEVGDPLVEPFTRSAAPPRLPRCSRWTKATCSS
jgi:uncharacterized protein